MIPGEARYLVDWSARSGISYHKFRQDQQFERSIRFGIDQSTKERIANDKELAQLGVSVLREESENLRRELSNELEGGFSLVSRDLGEINSAVQDVEHSVRQASFQICGSLYWGFTEVLTSLGRMNDSLDELVRLARNESKTWAYEQFENGRDEFRRGLFPEALDSVTRAIEGYESNVGYKTEFRFHLLLGTIRLGDRKNTSPDVLHPEIAEQAFLNSARYSETDFKNEAGRAYVAAARAAYVQRKFEAAVQHSLRGLSCFSEYIRQVQQDPASVVPVDKLNPHDEDDKAVIVSRESQNVRRFTNATKYNGYFITAECSDALYQLARVYSVQDNVADASECLFHALTLNPLLAVEAQGDLDLLCNKDMLHDTLRKAEEHLSNTYHDIRAEFGETVEAIREFTWEGISARGVIGTEIDAICHDVKLLDSQVSERRIMGTSLATVKLRDAQFALLRLFSPFKERCTELVEAAAVNSRREADATVHDAGKAIEAVRQGGVAEREKIAKQRTHYRWIWNAAIIAAAWFFSMQNRGTIVAPLIWVVAIVGLVALNFGIIAWADRADRECGEETQKSSGRLQEAVRQCQSRADELVRTYSQKRELLRNLARPPFWT